MTKMKSKKMTKSTFAVIIMAVLMVAMMAFGGTYAYFTAVTEAKSGTAKTGRVQLNGNSAVQVNAMVVPGQKVITDSVSVTSNSTVKTYVFVRFSATFTKGTEGTYVTGTPTLVDASETLDTEGEYRITPTMNLYDASTNPTGWNSFVHNNGTTEGADATKDDFTVYYIELEPSSTNNEGVITYNTINRVVCSDILFEGYSQSTETGKGTLMDGTLTVTIDSSSIQWAGFGDNIKANAEDTTKTYADANAAVLAAYNAAAINLA